MVLLLQISPFVGLLGYNLTGFFEWSMIGLARDALVLFLSTIVFFQFLLSFENFNPTTTLLFTLFLVAAIIGASVHSTADLPSVALNLRRLLLLPILFLAASMCRISNKQARRLLFFVLYTSVAVAFFGILEYISPNTLWTQIFRVTDYFSENPFDPYGTIPFEESGRFFTWDLVTITGTPIRRVVSTYLEPTTLGAALMSAICLTKLLPLSRFRKMVSLSILVTCGLLTFSKAFLIFLILFIVRANFNVPSPKNILLVTAIGSALSLTALSIDLPEGPFSHLLGFARSLVFVATEAPFGEGIGNAGNYATDDADLEIGGESGLGNTLAQVGVIALMYVAWTQQIANRLSKAGQAGKWIAFMVFCWFISFIFSASSLGVGGNALIFLIAGIAINPNFNLGVDHAKQNP